MLPSNADDFETQIHYYDYPKEKVDKDRKLERELLGQYNRGENFALTNTSLQIEFVKANEEYTRLS